MIDQFSSESDVWIDKISKCATLDDRIISFEHLSKEEIIMLIEKSLTGNVPDPMLILGYIVGCLMEQSYRSGKVKKHIEKEEVLYSPATQLS